LAPASNNILTTVEISPYDPSSETENLKEDTPKKFLAEEKDIISQYQEEPPENTVVEDKVSTAIIQGDLKSLMELLDCDYEPPIQTEIDKIRTPVFLSVEYNFPHILQYLLDLDTGDIDSSIPGWFNRTALHRAAENGNIQIVKMLLDAGANPSPKDIYSKTPYVLGNQSIRDFMRKYAGENPSKYDWEKLGITPLTQSMEEEKKQKLSDKNRRKKQMAKKTSTGKKITRTTRSRNKNKRRTIIGITKYCVLNSRGESIKNSQFIG